MNERAIDGPRGSSEPLSSGLPPEQLFVIPSVEDTHGRSTDGRPMAVALTAGLTPRPGGDQAPASAAYSGEGALPGGPDSPLAFDVAAVWRGHNISTVEGRENARHDFRVWDLVERMRP